jgi:hypothetical protein
VIYDVIMDSIRRVVIVSAPQAAEEQGVVLRGVAHDVEPLTRTQPLSHRVSFPLGDYRVEVSYDERFDGGIT